MTIPLHPTRRTAILGGGSALLFAPGALAGPREIAGRIYDAGNAIRKARGRSPLAFHAGLSRAAGPLAEAILRSGNLDHGADGRNLGARARAAGYRFERLAENIAWSSWVGDDARMAERLVALWMGSRGHRANLLDRRLRDIGVAVAADGRSVAAVQMFGRPR